MLSSAGYLCEKIGWTLPYGEMIRILYLANLTQGVLSCLIKLQNSEPALFVSRLYSVPWQITVTAMSVGYYVRATENELETHEWFLNQDEAFTLQGSDEDYPRDFASWLLIPASVRQAVRSGVMKPVIAGARTQIHAQLIAHAAKENSC